MEGKAETERLDDLCQKLTEKCNKMQENSIPKLQYEELFELHKESTEKYENLQVSIDLLKSQCDSAEKMWSYEKGESQRLEKLCQELTDKCNLMQVDRVPQAQYEELLELNKDSAKECKSLQEANDTLKEKFAKLFESSQEWTKKEQSLEKELYSLTKARNQMQITSEQHLQQEKEKYQELLKNHQSLTEEVNKVNKEREISESKHEILQTNYDELLTKYNKLDKSNTLLNSNYDWIETRCSDLGEMWEEEMDKNKKLEEKILEL